MCEISGEPTLEADEPLEGLEAALWSSSSVSFVSVGVGLRRLTIKGVAGL
jgi:hypothetical protein